MSLIFAVLFYFAPTLVAYARQHKSRAPILVLNLIFGWTLVGWVVCLIWSLLK